MKKSSYPVLKELPESERPREKLISLGSSALSDAELLAILISSGRSGESAISLSMRILSMEKNDGLKGLSSYVPEEFMKVKGIGMAKACQLTAAIELGKRIAALPPKSRICIDRPDAIADYFMERLRGEKKEHFMIAMLNVKCQITGSCVISSGGISGTSALGREVFAPAVKKGAAAIILVHNHPSGDPSPSSEDIKTTVALTEAGNLLGIKVIDHIIIGDSCYYSMREHGDAAF